MMMRRRKRKRRRTMMMMTNEGDLQLNVESDTRQRYHILHAHHFNFSEEKFTFHTPGLEFETFFYSLNPRLPRSPELSLMGRLDRNMKRQSVYVTGYCSRNFFSGMSEQQ
jgi:hypothetical protein